jgi:hypothetical protein
MALFKSVCQTKSSFADFCAIELRLVRNKKDNTAIVFIEFFLKLTIIDSLSKNRAKVSKELF